MATVAPSSAWCAWPPAARGTDSAQFYARAFGSDDADLDIAFDTLPRPTLVSALLSVGVRTSARVNLDPATSWRWHIADRLQALLAIVSASGADTLHAQARCPLSSCQQNIELELPLANFGHVSPDTTLLQIPDGTGAGTKVALRLPTGDDQRAWSNELTSGAIDERRWARDLIIALDDAPPAGDWQPPATWIDAIGNALDAIDPLTALTLDVVCPYCDASVAVDVDLEQLALDRLRQAQHALLDDVHRLARAYHWSERDIVNLPAWRRARYCARLETEWA